MEVTPPTDAAPVYLALADANAMGLLNDRWTPMRTEIVDSEWLFLVTHACVAPWTVFELLLGTALTEPPVRAIVTASYVEKTREGYGLGCEISCMSSSDQKRWEQHCHSRAADPAATPKNCPPHHPGRRHPTVLVVGQSLSAKHIDELRDRGVSIRYARDADSARSTVEQCAIHLVIADREGAGVDGVALCRQLARCPEAPPIVLRTRKRQGWGLDDCLAAGAVMATTERGAQRILIGQLLGLLQRNLSRHLTVPSYPALLVERTRELVQRPQRILKQLSSWLTGWLTGSPQVLS